nr:MAG TPA_asm: hypothetical protein [Caudoviricetes sp.]
MPLKRDAYEKINQYKLPDCYPTKKVCRFGGIRRPQIIVSLKLK